MRRLELYSPISPLWTGTATYFAHVARRLRALGFGPDRVTIVVDRTLFGQGQGPVTYLGFPVRDSRGESNVVEADVSRIFFLANNEWHAFIFRALERARALPGGRIIAVVHEPAVAMVMAGLTAGEPDCPDRFAAMLAPQYGEDSPRLAALQRQGALPDLFGFISHAQAIALKRAHEIWTHSRFAAFKLLLESEAADLPRLRIAAHPHVPPHSPSTDGRPGEAPELGALAKRDGVTRLGLFGWVSRPKRIVEILEGLSLALDRLSPAARDKVELVVVGALPAPGELDVGALCRRLGLTDHVRLLSFVPAQTFSALIGSCDLVFNLRYPSCGETSGTLAHAAGHRVRTVTSRYQAFSEEEADLTIAPIPVFEPWLIAGAIVAAVERRSDLFDAAPGPRPRAAPVDKLIALEALGALMPGPLASGAPASGALEGAAP